MGLLSRIEARTVARRVEARSSIDMWIDQYLLPANQFSYNGTTYPFGLNTTWSASRQKEIANGLPGYLGALRGCPPAFAAQMVRALVLSQARFVFRNRPTSSTPRRTFGTRELGILERPWPNATTGQMLARMEWHAGLAGNAYVLRQPDRLRVLRPDWVAILYGSQLEPDDPTHALDGEVIGYVYQPNGFGSDSRPRTLLPGDVAHWSPQPDPERAEIGMSWITPALRDIQADRAATEHTLQFFAHGATPNLVVKGIPAATKTQFDEIVDAMEERHAGVMNAYRTLYLTAGADATVVGANLEELGLTKIQANSETRVTYLSRVPATLLGIAAGLEGSTLNAGNFGQARRTFSDSWVYPTLQDLSAALSPLVKVPSDAELWFDVSDIPLLREDASDAATIAQTKSATIVALVNGGFEPDSAKAYAASGDPSVLKHTGMVSVQLQPPGSAPPAPDAGPKAPAAPAARRFNPDEPRRPDGKWGTGGVHLAKKIAKLDTKDFETDKEHTADQVLQGAGRRVAANWKVSDADLESLIREDGRWDAFKDYSPKERREHYVTAVIQHWNGSSGGPIPTAAITHVLDRLGVEYKLSDSAARPNAYIRGNPALARATGSLGDAMYQTTQDWFNERGITHVHALRASVNPEDDKSRPFTSWALHRGGLRDPGNRTIREEDIPASRIFAIPPTGFGNLDESELVVLPLGGGSARSMRKFNPEEPRIPGGPHGGEWGSGGAAHALKDALKLGDKADLQPGEKLVGSDKLNTDSGVIRMALVDHGGHKSLRLGIGGYGFGGREDEAGPWRAGPDRTEAINAERKKLQAEQKSLEDEWNRLDADPHADLKRKAAIEARLEQLDGTNTADVFPGGFTANLDPQAAEHLRSSLATALDAGEKVQATVDTHFDEIDRLEVERNKLRGMPRKWTDEEDKLWDSLTAQIEALQANPPEQAGGTWGDYFSAEGTVPGQWADVNYAVYLDDPDPSIGLQVTLGAVPHGSGRDLSDLSGYEQAATLDPAETKKFLRMLDQYTGPTRSTRAAGHDTTPGHDELHHYWTVGAGREKWVHLPRPWTTLVALLTPHVGPEKAKVYASRWFIEVKGYAAGSDLNRVAHGKPPRGHKVGPG